jgi:transcriptional regulator with XRE-family HTH domain
VSEFTAGTLRELRLRAGLTQAELSRRSGVCAVTIGYIEQGRTKPRELTWRSLLKALSAESADKEQPSEGKEPGLDFFGEVLLRDEFFRRLKMKMSGSVAALFNDVLVAKLIEAAEFFSRTKYYPGDFATAMEILGKLLRTQKRPGLDRNCKKGQGKKRQLNPYKRRRHGRRPRGQENG